MISFAQKTYVQGTLTSKLHVIELGAAPGGPELLHSAEPCTMATSFSRNGAAYA